MGESIKTVVVTDVPFWNRKTGAQTRIAQLVDSLQIPPFDTRVLVTRIGQSIKSDGISEVASLNLAELDLTQPPGRGWREWTRWKCAAIANYLGWPSTPHQPNFNRYYPQLLVDRFNEFIAREKPDIILFEYATQIQLLRNLPRRLRQNLIAVLDSHDILWKRAQQFSQHGQIHWIHVNREDEEAALREFDLILAIGGHEASYFEELVGCENVIVTSLEFDADQPLTPSEPIADEVDSSSAITIGHMASANWANVDAVQQILKFWSDLSAKHPHVNLLLAGDVCHCPDLSDLLAKIARVKVMGTVPRPDDFYRQVDLVWNPIRYGTGLKIKNLEALSRAKCLVTSPHGSEGLYPNVSEGADSRTEAPFVIQGSASEMDSFLQHHDRKSILDRGLRGQNHLKKHFGRGTQYPKLRRKLQTMLSR